MSASVSGACLHAAGAAAFRVECLIGRGLPRVQLVGLPDLAARETKERLPAAFEHCGLNFPKSRVLFNLVPAQLPKRGFPLDLALATSLLVASHQVPPPGAPLLTVAELDLAGQLRPVPRGVLLAARTARASGAVLCVAPADLAEAQLLPGVRVVAPPSLRAWVHALRGNHLPAPHPQPRKKHSTARSAQLDEVRGQEHARQAAILAAAGRHSLLLQGPPGTGKSLLARKVARLLPTLDDEQALQLACLESLHGPVPALPQQAPFRAPHHTTSPQALLGGGRPVRPGELSRAHGGVLFLDEFPEFARPALEGLRQPLEEHEVRIERTQESACFPAHVLLIAARNPCPCGYATHPHRACHCTPAAVQRYARRTSGPLLDRFDLFAEMGPVAPELLQGPPSPPTDDDAAQALQAASKVQAKRKTAQGWARSARAQQDQITAAGISSDARQLWERAAREQHWSGRAVLRVLRVARTIADCAGEQTIHRHHLLQAVAFRPPHDLSSPPVSPAPSATD